MVVLILVDSNIWIFATIEEYPENNAAKEKLLHIVNEGIAINSIIFSEVFHKLYKLTSLENALKAGKKILDSDYVFYIPIEENTIVKSMDIAKKGIRINDSIIAQHAKDMKIKIFTDNIKDFKNIEGLDVIRLR